MATKKNAARSMSPHGIKRCSEALLVTFCTATLWWSMGSQLSEGKIAAEHGQTRGAEGVRQRHKKGRVAVGSRAVCQDETVASRTGRVVKKPSNRHPILWSIPKFPIVVHSEGSSRGPVLSGSHRQLVFLPATRIVD
jgi:hypothetical protein